MEIRKAGRPRIKYRQSSKTMKVDTHIPLDIYTAIKEHITQTKPANKALSNWIREACIERLERLGIAPAQEPPKEKAPEQKKEKKDKKSKQAPTTEQILEAQKVTIDTIRKSLNKFDE